MVKQEVTLVQESLAMVQQSSFLFPQLSAFLEKPLDWKGAGGEIRYAGIVLVAIFHGEPTPSCCS